MILGLFAHPVDHSLSPLIHHMAWQQIKQKGRYLKIDSTKEALVSSFQYMQARYKEHWRGANFSLPHKTVAIQLADEVDEMVTLTQSMNTIVCYKNKNYGYNTDGKGFIQSLHYQHIPIAKHRHWTILGSGGAARSIIAQAVMEGIEHITIFCHKEQYIEETKAWLAKLAKLKPFIYEVHTLTIDTLQEKILQSDVMIQSLPLHYCPIDASFYFPKHLVVVDVNYYPLESECLTYAKQAGCQAVNGIGMLIFQGIIAFQLWTGECVDAEPIFQLFDDYLITHHLDSD